jgi:hypothetical protein
LKFISILNKIFSGFNPVHLTSADIALHRTPESRPFPRGAARRLIRRSIPLALDAAFRYNEYR